MLSNRFSLEKLSCCRKCVRGYICLPVSLFWKYEKISAEHMILYWSIWTTFYIMYFIHTKEIEWRVDCCQIVFKTALCVINPHPLLKMSNKRAVMYQYDIDRKNVLDLRKIRKKVAILFICNRNLILCEITIWTKMNSNISTHSRLKFEPGEITPNEKHWYWQKYPKWKQYFSRVYSI